MRADPFSLHHWSVWGGLVALNDQGLIRLRHEALPAPEGPGMWLRVYDLDTRALKSVWVDVSDRSPEHSSRRDAADASWVRNAPAGLGRPLGFVAPMRPGTESRFRYLAAAAGVAARERRIWPVRASISALYRSSPPPLISDVESQLHGDQSIFFQVRCWEPDEGGDRADRHRVNDSRADVIRSLRRELGARFVGGFQQRPFAVENYPDCVSPLGFDQSTYFRALQRSAVVVATIGLHGSIPWKLAEYAAMSKAVVSERICNAVPESHRGVYEEFDTTEQCVEACVRLLDSPTLTRSRQAASGCLWRAHVRPDRLVFARLQEEFGG